MPVQIPIDYAPFSEPLRRSRCGIAAFILSLIALVPAAVLALVAQGIYSLTHDPAGDAGGPLFLLAFAMISLLVAIGVALLWIVGFAFALTGLIRTRGRCRWSRVATLILLSLLIVGTLTDSMVWHFVL